MDPVQKIRAIHRSLGNRGSYHGSLEMKDLYARMKEWPTYGKILVSVFLVLLGWFVLFLLAVIVNLVGGDAVVMTFISAFVGVMIYFGLFGEG